MLHFPATVPSRGPMSLSGVRMAVTRIVCVILIPFRQSQISCFTLSLKFFSSVLNNCPDVGIGPLLQFPYPLGAGPVLLTLLFFPLLPSSYRVLGGSIYSFPVVRYSCLLSTGFMQAILGLRCISDVSAERDVLHVHLLLLHLVLLYFGALKSPCCLPARVSQPSLGREGCIVK